MELEHSCFRGVRFIRFAVRDEVHPWNALSCPDPVQLDFARRLLPNREEVYSQLDP